MLQASGEVPASPANCAAALFDEARGLLEAKGKGRTRDSKRWQEAFSE